MSTVEIQIAHLKKDKKLAALIKKVGVIKQSKNTDLYYALINSIVSQQLSIKAADTIFNRFLDLFKDRYPDAKTVLKMDVEKMRAAGLSYQKAGYIKNIAQFSIEETLDYKKLKKLNDEDLINYLTQIKGVGRWTVEMILMFSLQRENILPLDDLGIQNGIKKIYNLSSEKKELKLHMIEIANKWEPYRSLACKYIWRYKDEGN